MNFKTSKTLSIIAASIILLSFFLPWTKSIFGSSTSAWDIVEELFTMLTKAKRFPDDIRAFLPFILIALPIFSTIIIIKNAKTINDNVETTKNSKVVSIIVVILVIITLIYVQTKNPFSNFSNIFDFLGIGFYLTLIGSIYYLIDIVMAKTELLTENNSSQQSALFCSNCGKQFSRSDIGQHCDQCGTKL